MRKIIPAAMLILSMVASSFSYCAAANKAVGSIDIMTLKSKFDKHEKMTLVEALDANIFKRSHLPGSVDIPSGQSTRLASGLLPDKRAEVVVYCMNFM